MMKKQMRLFLKLLFDIQWKNKSTFAMFMLIPILIGMILQVGRYFVPVSIHDEQNFDSFSVKTMFTKNFKSSDTFEVFFTPENELTTSIMDKTCEELRQSFITYDWTGRRKISKDFIARGFQNEAILEETALNRTNLLAGVVFENINVEDVDFSYKIRPSAEARTVTGLGKPSLGWLTAYLVPTRSRLSPNGGVSGTFSSPFGDAPYYYKEGFLTLQHNLNNHFMELVAQSKNKSEAEIEALKSQGDLLNRFPKEKSLNDPLAGILEQHLSFVILLAFCFLGQQVVKRIANDKESRLKEYMLMMKLGRDVLWRSYFVFYAILALLAAFCFTTTIFLPISGNGVLSFSSFSVIFVFCFLYCCSLITLSFLTTVFFSTGSAASAASTTIIFFLFIPYSFIAIKKSEIFSPIVTLMSFSSPVAMSIGCSIIASKEVDGVGVTWSNLGEPVSLVDDDSMRDAFIMLILDTILYYVLARYLDMVYPGKYGIAKPWNFFNSSKMNSNDPKTFLKTAGQKSTGIIVHEVEKTFAISNFGIRKALDKVSFTCPQDQVTVLLGPNGAGKSTLMNVMCGTLKADTGSVQIDGHCMDSEPELARKSLGMCPQFDIVIDGLTPHQHLLFFAQLKGSSKDAAQEEAENLLSKMKLESKTNTPVEDLSGGMRRKLSLAIALCGGSRAIVLDEPSSGLDVVSRTEIWEIISKYSAGKTILLSTHYTDEAEALADNIVVMAGGNVLRAEPVTQFKSSTSSGFLLSISLTTQSALDSFSKWLHEFDTNAQIVESSGTHLSILLPKTQNPKFFFNELETRKTELGVAGFSINDEGLEQSFMKIINENATENFHMKKSAKKELEPNNENERLIVDPFLKPTLSGLSLWWGQFIGCMMKNYFHWKKNWKIFLCELLVPALMTFISVRQIVTAPQGRFSPEIGFTIDEYSQAGIKEVTNFEWISPKYEINEHILALDQRSLAFGLSVFEGQSKDKQVIGWFNPQMYHSAPAALQQVSNYLLADMLNSTRDNFIAATNHPLPMPETLLSEHAKSDFNLQAMTLVYNLIIGIMVMFSAFSLLPVREKKCGMNVLQTCAGVSQKIRWSAQYFWDLATCVPSILLVLVILIACREMEAMQAFIDHIDVLISIFILFSLAQLPMVYLTSFHQKDPASSICFNVNISVVFTMCSFLSVTLVRQFDTFEKAEMINSWFLWFPPHCFAMSIFDLYFNAQMGKTCETAGYKKLCDYGILPYVENPYSLENGGVGKYLVAFFAQIIFFWTLLMMLQTFDQVDLKTWLKKNIAKIYRKKEPEAETLDGQEKLIVQDLHKNYGKFKALKGINFDVAQGECIGLLGANGAGKSTTFKILTGQLQPNIGFAKVDRFDVSTQKSRALEKLGYCPQYDAILKQLSPNEVLQIFARLRGVEAKKIDPLVRSLIELLEISDYRDQSISELSGGTRRKVSVALTIIGDSQTIILDEPSCGLDPKSRKELRKVIKTLLEKGKSVLLSSHSMEECASLCQRMCILNKGSVAYFGSQQNLKNQFSKHLHVVIEIKEENRSAVLNGLKAIDPAMSYSTAGSNMIRALVDKNVRLSELFGFLESAQIEKQLKSYTVRETALEDIFHQIENSDSAISDLV